jgi:hypothetical protein
MMTLEENEIHVLSGAEAESQLEVLYAVGLSARP